MKMWEMLQAAYDFWRPNKYGISRTYARTEESTRLQLYARVEHIQWCVLLLRVCR